MNNWYQWQTLVNSYAICIRNAYLIQGVLWKTAFIPAELLFYLKAAASYSLKYIYNWFSHISSTTSKGLLGMNANTLLSNRIFRLLWQLNFHSCCSGPWFKEGKCVLQLGSRELTPVTTRSLLQEAWRCLLKWGVLVFFLLARKMEVLQEKLELIIS